MSSSSQVSHHVPEGPLTYASTTVQHLLGLAGIELPGAGPMECRSHQEPSGQDLTQPQRLQRPRRWQRSIGEGREVGG